MKQYVIAFAIILMAVITRLLPHPANFSPIAAIALFGGAYLDKKSAFLLPLAALLISDYFIGFYPGMEWVYGSFLLIGLLGLLLRDRHNIINIIMLTTLSSQLFFCVTNFGVWLGSGMYPLTWAGLLQCYSMATPFYQMTALGDAVYVGVMFGAYELVKKLFSKQLEVA